MKTNTEAKPRAYSYLRFSSPEQAKGDSERRQTDAAAAWCERNDIQLAEGGKYKDLGVSAFRGKNAETGHLAAFLKLVRAGKIETGSYLIVESLDRITRSDIMTAFDLFRDIIKAGVRIVTLADGHIYDQDKISNGGFTDLIISLTVLSRANEESRTKAMRVGQAWDRKRRNIGTEKLTSNGPGWLRLAPDRKSFIPIPDRAALVKRVFEMARSGLGAYRIGKQLRQEGVKPFGKAKCWSTAYTKQLLCNRAVLGEFTPSLRRGGEKAKRLEAIPNYYPAIVSKPLFATVSQTRKVRANYRGRSSYNVFSKLAFDCKTGSPMVYLNKVREKGWHYLIASAALLQRTEYVTWQYDDFLASFLTVCREAALSKPPTVEKDDSRLVMAKTQLDDTQAQIGRLVEYLAKGTASASVDVKLRELELEKAAVERQIVDLENESAAKPASPSTVNWKDHDALRENLRATVKRITVDAKGRSFEAQFLDGRSYSFKRDGSGVTITTPDAPA